MNDELLMQLDQLPATGKKRFLLSCMERSIHLYRLFENQYKGSDANNDSVTFITDFMQNKLQSADNETIETVTAKLESLFDDLDDHINIYDEIGIYTIAIVKYLINHHQEGSDEYLNYCSNNMMELVNLIKKWECYLDGISEKIEPALLHQEYIRPHLEREVGIQHNLAAMIRANAGEQVISKYISNNKILYVGEQ